MKQNYLSIAYIQFSTQKIDGGLAQLGERLNGIQKVRGSNPLSSIFTTQGLTTNLRSKNISVFAHRSQYAVRL